MSLAVDIVKHGHSRGTEKFSADKLQNSIREACLSVRTPVGQADSIARIVTEHVVAWLADKPEVTSQDLRKAAAAHLRSHHPDAAYIYEHHKVIM